MKLVAWLALGAALGGAACPRIAEAQTATATAALGPPPYGREDVPALEKALEAARARFEAALERWNGLTPEAPSFDRAEAELRAAEARKLELAAALKRAESAPARALVKRRLAYDRLVEKVRDLHRALRVLPRAAASPTAPEATPVGGEDLVLGGLAETIFEAEQELEQLQEARRALDAPPSESARIAAEQLSDLEKLDEELRLEEERLAFSERLHTHLELEVFGAYAAYESAVDEALAAFRELKTAWLGIRGTPAESYLGPAPSPTEVAKETILDAKAGEPGIRALWEERGGVAGSAGPLSARAHAGQLADYRREAAQRRILRDRLLEDADKLRALEAQRPKAETPSETAVPRVVSGSEYARLSDRIEQAESRIETLEREEAELVEGIEAVQTKLRERRAEIDTVGARIEEMEARLETKQEAVELVFPTRRGGWAERSARIQNFILREKIASARAFREALDRAVRRTEIRRDVLQRRYEGLQRERLETLEVELPRLRTRYYTSLLETFGIRGLRVLVVLLIAYALLRLIRKGSGPFIEGIVERSPKRQGVEAIRQQRARTLMSVFVGASKFVIYLLATLFIVAQLDIDYGPLLVAAGGLSLAVGFGAQSLVKDFFAGFFILLEGQYSIGDVVDIEGRVGIVEDLNLRTTTLRSLNGEVHVIPNGEIKITTNMTKLWSRSVVDISVAYEENVDDVIAILRRIGDELLAHEHWGERLRSLDVLGVQSFGDSSVDIRVLLETEPGEQWATTRELQRRIKLAFDDLGVEIPWPQRVVTHKEGPADAQSLRRKKAAIRRFVGETTEDHDHPAPSVEERDRADAIANKEASLLPPEESGDPASTPDEAPTIPPETGDER